MDEIENSTRLEEFEQEIESINVTGGRANPERRFITLGVIVGLLGIVLVFASFLVVQSGVTQNERFQYLLLGFLGLCLLFIGTIFYVTNKLTRFFRYWLIRLIYEHRAQIDRLEKK